MAPVVIVYEKERPIKSYSLKDGYKNIFYSTLEQNLFTTTTSTITTNLNISQTTNKPYNLYEVCVCVFKII